jgi:Activator of Hsp90 ATPase homolog 1-like protein
MTEPIRLSFELACPQATAFSTWTTRASTWWPADHSVSGERGIEVVFEEHVGGRIFERTMSGVERDWGWVTAWEPPSRLAFAWHLHFAPEDATDVEIRFIDSGRDRTRVEIEHGGWERLGERAPERREGNRRGWDSVLPYFVEAIERGEA